MQQPREVINGKCNRVIQAAINKQNVHLAEFINLMCGKKSKQMGLPDLENEDYIMSKMMMVQSCY